MNKVLTTPLVGVYNSGKWVSIPDTSITKNGISEIVLRGWQSEILNIQKESKSPHLFINCPTGSGKSKACLAIIVETERNSDNLIIISAPQKEIGKGFLSSSGSPQKILDHTWLINPQNQLCEGHYKNEDGNIARLLEFLKAKRTKDLNERILICCHATLSLLFDRLNAYDREKYLKGIKLCIDESHHSLSQEETGNGLGKVVNYFLKHSEKDLDLVMMTATPFRGDKGSLIPEKYFNDFCRYDLDYGRHFEENCAGLEFTYNAVLHQYGNSYSVVIEELMNKYLNHNDKVLVQIPPSNKGISNGKFTDLQMIYDSIGTDQFIDDDGVVNIKRHDRIIKVIDLVTENNRIDRLDYLRNNPDDIDVVIGISMIKEGFDWPPANAGILIGSQGSLNAQIQLMGRMFRAYKNKGKNNGQKPVDISQVFPYVDHEKLDEDEVREQINTFMKIVYAALAMVLVINPIHIEIPTKVENGKTLPRKSVKNFLTESLTDTQYTELMATVMDEFRDWKATAGEDVNNSEKIAEIVTTKLTELGITDNHKEVAEFFNKSLQRSAKFQIMALQGIDVSHIDIDLMDDIEDPIDSILLGMSNGLCGAKDIREFQLLMKPIDTLRRCYELKEWVEKKNQFPKGSSEDKFEKSLTNFQSQCRYVYRHGVTEKSLSLSLDHIEILESIPDWKWEFNKLYESIIELKNWIEKKGVFPSCQSEDLDERRQWGMISMLRSAKKGKNSVKLTDDIINLCETIPNWNWEKNDIKAINKCLELKQWIEKNNKYPSQSSKNVEERAMYRFIHGRRQAMKAQNRSKITESQIKILESFPNWKW